MHSLLLLAAVGCKVDDPGERPVRRLTPTEYNHTVRDLFGWSEQAAANELHSDDEGYEAWPWRFPPDVPVHGFEGMVEGQVASGYLVEQYQAAAAHFAPFVWDAPAFWACDDHDDEACVRTSVVRLAHRAYRRPLTGAEQSRLVAFHDANVGSWGLRNGTVLTTQGLLQSPQFLFRLEPAPEGGSKPVPLDGYELASRLSYFLYDSMPDPELFEAAATGRLKSRKDVEKQVRRMLDNPRARTAVVHFHRQWLGLDDVFRNRASLDAYSERYAPGLRLEFDGELQEAEEVWSILLIGTQAAMVREADLFVERTVFDGEGTLGALLTDNHGFATRFSESDVPFDTFVLYGLTEDDELPLAPVNSFIEDGNLGYGLSVRAVTFPRDQRAGILTLGATLAARAHPVHPAPVLRGVFVLERLACEDVGQPPDAAALAAPPDTLTADSTNRERLEAITANAPCSNCHERINPLGFAFETYDSLGGFRTTDNGSAVDASGTLRLATEEPVPFNGAVELARALAASPQIHDCYAKTWTQYALGVDVIDDDPSLAEVQRRFRKKHDGSVRELLVDIATSDAFRYRKE